LPPSEKPLLISPSLDQIKGFAATHPLTIQDAVAIALYTNRNLASSIASLQSAKARTGQARAALNPTFGINSQLTYFDSATTFNLAALAPAGTPPSSFTIVPQFNPVNTAAFTLPIDIAGSLRSAVSQAQFNEVASRIDVNRTRNQIIFDVKAAFYNVLRSQAQVAVATDNVNGALTRLSDANKNFAAGTSPYYDVLTAQRDVADAQQALINSQAQVTTNLSTLKNTIGLDVSSAVQISSAGAVEYPNGVTPLPPTPPDINAPGPISSEEPHVATNANFPPLPMPQTDVVKDTFDFGPDYAGLIQEALKTRPEVLESEAQVTAAQKGIQFARRSEMPSVSLSLEYQNTPNAAGFTKKNQGIATLGINIPIYDGGLAREREQESRAIVASAEVNRRTATDQVQLDVQQAYIALVQARNRVAVTNVEVAQAREAYRLARVRYNAGMTTQVSASPQLELINAQTSLTTAQTAQVNALYDYNSARAQLDRAVGRYSYVGVGPGYSAVPGDRIVKG
jgi:outer membrane protein TolC